MGRFSALAAMLALLGLATGASAAITIETVTVRDPGNTADSTGFGAVSYLYNIGKYEVTAGQYCAFLNAVAKTDTYGLYNVWMSQLNYYGCGISRSGSDGSYKYTVDSSCVNRPVNYVTFWDACRFANWLHNGQPTGNQDLTTTEDGAYYLNGFTGYDSGQIKRKPGAKWALPTENEWYKAAYYKAGGINAGYWLYPTRSDSQPGRDLADASGNNANYQGTPYPIQSPYYFTCVGEELHSKGV
jgi:sulfatase modifying factor 1